jgi:hypothetical protein
MRQHRRRAGGTIAPVEVVPSAVAGELPANLDTVTPAPHRSGRTAGVSPPPVPAWKLHDGPGVDQCPSCAMTCQKYTTPGASGPGLNVGILVFPTIGEPNPDVTTIVNVSGSLSGSDACHRSTGLILVAPPTTGSGFDAASGGRFASDDVLNDQV